MKEKILYYLGAGASANAMPLAKSVGKDINAPEIPGLAFALKNFDNIALRKKLHEKYRIEDTRDLYQRFHELSRMASEFGDVDTYAKYLHLVHPDGEKFKEVKRTLSEFFTLKQLLSKSPDPRYLPW